MKYSLSHEESAGIIEAGLYEKFGEEIRKEAEKLLPMKAGLSFKVKVANELEITWWIEPRD